MSKDDITFGPSFVYSSIENSYWGIRVLNCRHSRYKSTSYVFRSGHAALFRIYEDASSIWITTAVEYIRDFLKGSSIFPSLFLLSRSLVTCTSRKIYLNLDTRNSPRVISRTILDCPPFLPEEIFALDRDC